MSSLTYNSSSTNSRQGATAARTNGRTQSPAVASRGTSGSTSTSNTIVTSSSSSSRFKQPPQTNYLRRSSRENIGLQMQQQQPTSTTMSRLLHRTSSGNVDVDEPLPSDLSYSRYQRPVIKQQPQMYSAVPQPRMQQRNPMESMVHNIDEQMAMISLDKNKATIVPSTNKYTNQTRNIYDSIHQNQTLPPVNHHLTSTITTTTSSKYSNVLPSPSSTSSSSSSTSSSASPPLHQLVATASPNDNLALANLDNKGIVGLRNLGNTCFMNSILQCLSNTRCLLEYCLRGTYTGDINTTLSVMKGSLFRSYGNLIKQMWQRSGGLDVDPVSPSEFKNQIARFAPRFVGYQQQDAEEFLYYLLKGLHEDVNLVKKTPPSIVFDEKAWDRMSDAEKSEEHWKLNLRLDNSRISEMFVGQLKSTLKCTICNYKSPTYELLWHLAVPIPTRQSGAVTLDDCLRLFMTEEVLDGDNKPLCSSCKCKRQCTKRYTIERLPRILVIHLKRFLKSRYNNKININVDYPIENLDMSAYVEPSTSVSARYTTPSHCLYDLYGISLHSGSAISGHYVAYCKHPYNRRWHCFNDSQVREISYNALQDSNAYILFYQLRN